MTLEYLRQSLFFFRKNMLTLAQIQLPFILVLSLIGHSMLNESQGEAQELIISSNYITLALINMIIQPLYLGATIFFLQSVLNEKPYTAFQALTLGVSTWARLLMTVILFWIIAVIGFMALFVPGVWISTRMTFANFICVLENTSPTQALKQSFESSSDYFWLILKGIAIIVFGFIMLIIFLSGLLGDSLLMTFGGIILEFMLTSLIIIFGFRVYTLMREDSK